MIQLKKRSLPRRTFLRGLGGTVVSLPLLEIMLDDTGTAYAQSGGPLPKRYVVCFDGQSLGADNDPVHNLYVPDQVGPGYGLKTATQPLGDAGVTDVTTIVSGLEIPWGTSPPAGGRHLGFHIGSLSPLLSGMRSVDGEPAVRGVTSDQVVAQAFRDGGTPTTFESLVYRVQASWYLDVSAPYGRDLISYRALRDPIQATVSPKAAFDSLFTNFTPPDPQQDARREFLLRGRRSVLDLVKKNYERLSPQLGGVDKLRMEKHLDEIRTLERQVEAIPPVIEGSCAMLTPPGDDPGIGGNQTSNGGNAEFDVNAGYSNEDVRAAVFVDLIHMAITCDLTRVASLQFTMAQSHMNMYPLINIPYDLHEIGHSGNGTQGVSQGIAWHVKHYASLVKKLRDTPEGTGDLLDSTVAIFLNEGGHGYDPEGDKDNSSHSTERMACMYAGRVGGLKTGEHIVTDKAHPANVLITCMNAVGVQTDTLGEVTGALPELIG